MPYVPIYSGTGEHQNEQSKANASARHNAFIKEEEKKAVKSENIHRASLENPLSMTAAADAVRADKAKTDKAKAKAAKGGKSRRKSKRKSKRKSCRR